MGEFIDNLTGATRSRQEAQMALQRQQSDVAATRQLSQSAAETAKTAVSRQPVRGRRLLADASAASLPNTVA